MLLLMYFILHYITEFLKYLDFFKWQGTFFDEFTYYHFLFLRIFASTNEKSMDCTHKHIVHFRNHE